MSRAMGSHQNANTGTDTWLTPLPLIKSLGEFDLDPCTPEEMPWHTAKHRYTEQQNGLRQPWFGRVWLNPPYSTLKWWFKKLVEHNNGIGLLFARTETIDFFDWIWDHADSVLFLKGRLHFHYPDGTRAKANSGAPSVLVAYGENNVAALEDSNIPGKHLLVNRTPLIVVGISPTWLTIVSMAVRNCGDDELKPVYDMVQVIAAEKVQNNPHWKAKVRQQIQVYRKQLNCKGGNYEHQTELAQAP